MVNKEYLFISIYATFLVISLDLAFSKVYNLTMASEERSLVPSDSNEEKALARAQSDSLAWSEEIRHFRSLIKRRPLDLFIGRDRLAREWEKANYEAESQAVEAFEQDLVELGIVGDHELLAPANVQRGVWARADGAFEIHGSGFLLFLSMSSHGQYESDSRTVSSVQFAWSPNEQDILVTEIPVDKMVLRIDPEAETPRVSFVFNRPEFLNIDNLGIFGGSKEVSWTVKRHRYVNDYFKGKRLLNAVFTFARQEDLKGLPLSNLQPEL